MKVRLLYDIQVGRIEYKKGIVNVDKERALSWIREGRACFPTENRVKLPRENRVRFDGLHGAGMK